MTRTRNSLPLLLTVAALAAFFLLAPGAERQADADDHGHANRDAHGDAGCEGDRA